MSFLFSRLRRNLFCPFFTVLPVFHGRKGQNREIDRERVSVFLIPCFRVASRLTVTLWPGTLDFSVACRPDLPEPSVHLVHRQISNTPEAETAKPRACTPEPEGREKRTFIPSKTESPESRDVLAANSLYFRHTARLPLRIVV